MFISFLLSSLQQNILFYETQKLVNLILITPGYKFPWPPSPRLIRIQLSQSEASLAALFEIPYNMKHSQGLSKLLTLMTFCICNQFFFTFLCGS